MSEASEILLGEESEKNQREVVVHLVRHGDTDYKGFRGQDAVLSKIGEQQAREAGQKLFTEINDGEAVKFYSSPLTRALKTAEIMRETLGQEISRTGKKIKILKGDLRAREGLKSIDLLSDLYWQLRDEGIRDPVGHWLGNPAERPKEAITIFGNLIHHFRRLSARLGSEGPRLHLICVTHGGNPELFLSNLTGKSDIDKLGNLETIDFVFPTNEEGNSKVIFRGHEYQV